MKIEQAKQDQWKEAAALALQLWPDHQAKPLEEEFRVLLQDPDAAVFLAYREERPVGFAQCGIRRDYVEGSSGSPVGYLEGIYMEPPCRGQGGSKALLAACEGWCREKGCREMGSDCALENKESRGFHLHSGFLEAGRIICFIKDLER
ncbi:MAG: GNAT family N-acetyltransferase [Oscillospiraceae bacterium]|nr:GNAT family N-acetyltransferase [Oscillospiraceae bacterium]